MSKSERYIYVFDFENNLVNKGFKKELQKEPNIKEGTFNYAIERKSL